MVKVFLNCDTLNKDFTDKLKSHALVHYSEKFDSYLIKTEDYTNVFNELEFEKELEFDTEDLLDWDIKIMGINEIADVIYEGDYLHILDKSYNLLSYNYIELTDELVNDLCESEDWGNEVDAIVKAQVSANVSDELSDEIRKLKEKGFDIVVY
jgi:hypothetical protein